MSSWSSLTSGNAYKSPAFIALVSALCVAILLLLHHCLLVTCCRRGDRRDRDSTTTDRDRRHRRHNHHRHRNQRRRVAAAATANNNDGDDEDDDGDEEDQEEVSGGSATSRTHLVAAAVVCRYSKEESWKEPTCAVCLADFADGENVRVLPECMHYFHAECIDTWLRGGSNSCPMCRAETGTPTPTRTTTSPGSAAVHHLEVSVSLEEILVRS